VPQRRPNRTLGPGHDEFWNWCQKGELRLQRCEDCSQYCWPAVQRCEHCDGTRLAWRPMSGRGTLVSWCTFERDYYDRLLPMPWETILVELEEGPLFISNPQGFTWREVAYGMPLALAFVECEDEAGTFNLPVFHRLQAPVSRAATTRSAQQAT